MPRVVIFDSGSPLSRIARALLEEIYPVLTVADANTGVADYEPTHGICAGFREIIAPEVIALFPFGILNIHTSLLPIGRGAYPNVWAIINGSAAGVTAHLIDSGIDTGPIIAQRSVVVRDHDTAKTLHERLNGVAESLMRDVIPGWLRGEYKAVAQGGTLSPTKRKEDLETLQILADRRYFGTEIVDLLRARTFPPYPGIRYLAPDGKKYRLRIEMEPET